MTLRFIKNDHNVTSPVLISSKEQLRFCYNAILDAIVNLAGLPAEWKPALPEAALRQASNDTGHSEMKSNNDDAKQQESKKDEQEREETKKDEQEQEEKKMEDNNK